MRIRGLWHQINFLLLLALAVVVVFALPRVWAGGEDDERIYVLNPRNPDLYGEVFHLASALAASQGSYISIPYISGVQNPVRELHRYQQRLTLANAAISRKETTFAATLTEATRTGPTRATVLAALRAGLPPPVEGEMKSRLEGAWHTLKESEGQRDDASIGLGATARGLRFVDFLNSMGLGKRIIKVALTERLGPDRIFTKLIGQPKPDDPNAVFRSPRYMDRAASTRQFTNALRNSNQTALQDSGQAFAKAMSAAAPEARTFASQEIEAKIPAGRSAVAIWNRNSTYEPERNMTESNMLKLFQGCIDSHQTPIVFGPGIPKSWTHVQALIDNGSALDMTSMWTKRPFRNSSNPIADQLAAFDYLVKSGTIRMQVGMMGGALDGVAFATGVPTVEFNLEAGSTPRMEGLAKALPALQVLPIEILDHQDFMHTLENSFFQKECFLKAFSAHR